MGLQTHQEARNFFTQEVLEVAKLNGIDRKEAVARVKQGGREAALEAVHAAIPFLKHNEPHLGLAFYDKLCGLLRVPAPWAEPSRNR